MAKTKNRERREIEHLRGKIRKLEAELKYYKRLERPEEVEEQPDVTLDVCENCGKGKIQYMDLKFVELFKCNLCDWQKRQRK